MRDSWQQILDAILSLRFGWRSVLAFQLWFASLSTALFGPAFAWLLSQFVLATGSASVSNYELTGFFLSLPGVCFLMVFSAVSLTLVFLNNAGLVVIAGAIRFQQSVSPLRILLQNLFRFRRLMIMGLWALGAMLLLALPFAAVLGLIYHHWLSAADINYYLATHPPEWFRALWAAGTVAGVFALVGGWMLLRWSVAMQFVLYSDVSPLGALKASWRKTRGCWGKLLTVLGLWWGALTSISIFVGAAYTAMGHLILDWAGLSLAWVVFAVPLLTAGYFVGALGYGVVGSGVNELLLTNFFFQRVGPEIAFPTPPHPNAKETRFESIFRRVAWTLVIILTFGAAGGMYGALSSVRVDHQPLVTAHRGSSAAAPENSLSALRLAIEHGADFAEIDVQHTADGAIVLMHDADLMRIAGRSNRLAHVTLERARSFDISGRFKSTYAGERIGTLQEAIDLVSGKMRLNIELKYNVVDPTLASEVADLVIKNDFVDQCVITSLDLAPLLELETRWPELQTGLIVTAGVGDVTKTAVDFYSLNFAKATPAFIRLAHSRGKEVHVWTINEITQMHQMIELGADNLITDVPDQVRELIGFRGRLTPTERMALRLRNGFLYGY